MSNDWMDAMMARAIKGENPLEKAVVTGFVNQTNAQTIAGKSSSLIELSKATDVVAEKKASCKDADVIKTHASALAAIQSLNEQLGKPLL